MYVLFFFAMKTAGIQLCLMDDDEHIGGLALLSYTLYIYIYQGLP